MVAAILAITEKGGLLFVDQKLMLTQQMIIETADKGAVYMIYLAAIDAFQMDMLGILLMMFQILEECAFAMR